MKRSDGKVVAGSAVGAIGAAVAAMLATLCCAGPAVVAVLGAGGALAAAKLEPYRPCLLAVAAAMIGIGFWRAYRPGAAAEGAVCSIRTGRIVRSLLWIAALITLASALAPRFLS